MTPGSPATPTPATTHTLGYHLCAGTCALSLAGVTADLKQSKKSTMILRATAAGRAAPWILMVEETAVKVGSCPSPLPFPVTPRWESVVIIPTNTAWSLVRGPTTPALTPACAGSPCVGASVIVRVTIRCVAPISDVLPGIVTRL